VALERVYRLVSRHYPRLKIVLDLKAGWAEVSILIAVRGKLGNRVYAHGVPQKFRRIPTTSPRLNSYTYCSETRPNYMGRLAGGMVLE
jgi:hypothetical protein